MEDRNKRTELRAGGHSGHSRRYTAKFKPARLRNYPRDVKSRFEVVFLMQLPCSKQPASKVNTVHSEFMFLGNPFESLAHVFHAILKAAAIKRQQFHNRTG
jgi:hypothetical protein